MKIGEVLNKFFSRCFGGVLVKESTYKQLWAEKKYSDIFQILSFFESEIQPIFYTHVKHNRSQLNQDICALAANKFKSNGFFVEFGATNGVNLSNTYFLERYYNWNGILAEPCKSWHADLKINRQANISTDCVWSSSNEQVIFKETSDPELSTVESFGDDIHRKNRNSTIEYLVNTISLLDLLQKYSAPHVIDYLSIDTEGSEFEILKTFDFERYRFNFISIEHNFSESRNDVINLLLQNGYTRILGNISSFDDWYVPTN